MISLTASEQHTHTKCHRGTFVAAITSFHLPITVMGLAGSRSCASHSFAAQHPLNAVCWTGSLAIPPILQPSCSLKVAEAYHFIYAVIQYSSVTLVKLVQEWKQSAKLYPRQEKYSLPQCVFLSASHALNSRDATSCFLKLGIFWI